MRNNSIGVKSSRLVLALALVTCARAAEYQWSVDITGTTSPETNRPPHAFLWIPPDCSRVRAVIVSQQNLEEEQIFEHPGFRKALAGMGVAEVWIAPPLDAAFRFDRGNAAVLFQKMLGDLAKVSGYAEIENAPLIPLGHSAAASYPFNYAAWKPERTLAAISVSGQWPYYDPSRFNMGGRNMAGVPGLVTMGEYEWAESRATDGLKERREHPEMALGMLCEPGAGHFDSSDAKIEYLALYIRKALQYRLEGSGQLRPIDPRREGWLYDRWHRDAGPAAPAAPVAKYTGDPANAWWTFDKEMAVATEKLQARYHGGKVALLGYVQNGQVIPQVAGTHQQVTVPFLPIGDGLTFKLGGAFLDVVPAGRPERWTGRKQGSAVTHPASAAGVETGKICGPVEKLAADTFAVRFYRMGMDNRKRTGDIWLRAVYAGDAEYRRTVQQALLRIPLRNIQGAEQRITFPEIADQVEGTSTVPLKATSDSKAEVHYYVVAGPAEVAGNTLRLGRIPPRAAFPVAVRVLAWQWGRSIAPLLQSAEPVERTFFITKKGSRFIHPGLLHNRQDLERMKEGVAGRKEPIVSGYEQLRAHPQSQADYAMRGPFEEIGRNPTIHFPEFDQDANAAYQNAILWAITGNRAHADKSREILDAWASTLKRVSGADAVLMASLGPFKMVNAAEILRHTNASWSEAEARQFERLCREVFYPELKDFALFANGNWDTAAVKMVMAMGVFCNDRAMYERALRYYVNGAGDGRLTHYIYENGQCQESGRDQAHTQLGLGHLGDSSEIAWNQGLDLYAAANNRLLAGFDYTAIYNLGYDVPFVPDLDRTGKYAHAGISPRGRFRPLFEQIYNHFANRLGLPAAFTQEAAEKLRPEGEAHGADHPGFGTLLFSRPRGADVWAEAPAPPGGVVAEGSAAGVRLRWVKSRGAASYAVKRATAGGGPYAVMARGLKTPEFTDSRVKPGALYYYVVAAENFADSVETAVSAGLPSPWAHKDVGEVAVIGSAAFDGSVFTLEGAGAGIGGARDQFQFAYVPMTGDGSITARFVPQVSSQFSRLGLMMRDTLAAGSAHAALLLAPASAAAGRERPGWNVKMSIRAAAGADSTVAGASPNLAPPYARYGRLMEPYWLRLERSGCTFIGSISPDGRSWTKVAEAKVALKDRIYAGLPVCSSLTKVTTTVMFDNVAAPDWNSSKEAR